MKKSLEGENQRFVAEYANPHAWLITADNLHDQAVSLFARRSSSGMLTKVDMATGAERRSVLIDKPVFLLGGFALENAIKAFLVYEHPDWISHGQLSSNLQSHKL